MHLSGIARYISIYSYMHDYTLLRGIHEDPFDCHLFQFRCKLYCDRLAVTLWCRVVSSSLVVVWSGNDMSYVRRQDRTGANVELKAIGPEEASVIDIEISVSGFNSIRFEKNACKMTDILSWPQCAKTRYHTYSISFSKMIYWNIRPSDNELCWCFKSTLW